jgi:hypothetical protein
VLRKYDDEIDQQQEIRQILLFLHTKIHGRLTEWLGSGLQNRLRRFESATDLNPIKTP